MISAGLTGGIASGKTTVAGFFRDAGAAVVDADRMAHEVLREPEVRTCIVDRLGETVLDAAGEVDRHRLGPKVFGDDALRTWLNELVHPRVRHRIREAMDTLAVAAPDGVIIVDVPLLIESGHPRRYGPVILAYCPPAVQLDRLVRRDGLPPEEARARIRSQLPIDEKRPHADYLIDTTRPMTETRLRVTEVLAALRHPRP